MSPVTHLAILNNVFTLQPYYIDLEPYIYIILMYVCTEVSFHEYNGMCVCVCTRARVQTVLGFLDSLHTYTAHIWLLPWVHSSGLWAVMVSISNRPKCMPLTIFICSFYFFISWDRAVKCHVLSKCKSWQLLVLFIIIITTLLLLLEQTHVGARAPSFNHTSSPSESQINC